jgi:DNA polymerase phi
VGKVKVKGQEERDLLFARLFGLYAIIRSDIFSDESLAKETDFKRAVEIVWLLGRSKTWLRESSGYIIVEAVRSISTSNISWKDSSLKWLASKICEAREVGSESLAIYVALSTSSIALPTLPTLTSSHLLASANLAPLARILKEGVGAEADTQSTSGGSIQMQVHFVWDMLLQQYTISGTRNDDNKAPLSEFYRVLVDEALFATSASDQKKSWGFQIFEKALQIVSQDDLPCVFTANFMRTWTNQLADKNRMLFKAATRCMTTIQAAIKQNSSIGLPILQQLLSKQNHSTFPVKLVESVLSSMSSSEGVIKYVDHLIQSTESDSESTQRWALDQLSSLVRNSSLPINENCVSFILTLLAIHGFFNTKAALKTGLPGSTLPIQIPEATFSTTLKAVCRTRFYSCLGDVCDQSVAYVDGQGRIKKRQGQTVSGQSWIAKGFEIFEGLAADTAHFSTMYKRTSDEAFSKRRAFSKKLTKAAQKNNSTDSKTKIQDFNSMLLAGMLYSYNNLEQNETADASLIDPMIECGNRLVLGQKVQEGEPSAMELFIHCLVSYMEQSSAFLRSAATQAFSTFTDEMNREALDQLLDQLGFNTDKDAESEEVEGEAEDDDAEEEEDEDLDDILSDTISETSATSVSSSKDATIDPVFVAKLQEVLKAGGAADSDAESSTGDKEDTSSSSSSEASDFNDDQMMLIDDKLADIFRQKLGTRREEEEAKKETVALHIKLVDLLDVYARKQSGNELCISLVLPLFTIALEKDAALGQLKQRATVVLSKTLCKNKDGLNGTISSEQLIEPMEAVHKMAATKLPTETLNLCSTVNIYLTKACKEGDLIQGRIRDLYLATLQDFIQRKTSNLRPPFLIDAFQRSPLLGFSLRNEILNAASGPQQSAKDSYRQLQAWEMLRVTLSSLANNKGLESDLIAFLPSVSKKIIDIVAKEKLRLKEIVKVALDLARLTKRVTKTQSDVEKIWSPAKINEVIDSVAANDQLPNAVSLQALLRQLLAIVSDQKKAVSNGKRKNEEEDTSKKQKKKQLNT